jgi:hypothetical protein
MKGADDIITEIGLTASEFKDLPRDEILPPLIHLVDLELTRWVTKTVRTDIVVAGVGESSTSPVSGTCCVSRTIAPLVRATWPSGRASSYLGCAG